jgi:hypothetical protein
MAKRSLTSCVLHTARNVAQLLQETQGTQMAVVLAAGHKEGWSCKRCGSV